LRSEEPCKIRTPYQRDRDRIIHCKSFRRLAHKTQVFLAPEGDHYRTRLTHTLEVSQIARTIARALRLNEDLTEAIALGHDLGHTPFGHAGERAMDEVCDGGFTHYRQSLRVVDFLENDGRGLNLTAETRNGIVNHTGENLPNTMEGSVIKLSDRIAYINHDIDDAIRGGILTPLEIPEDICTALGKSHRERINTMVENVLLTSMDKPYIRMSGDVEQATARLRSFLFERVYTNPAAKGQEAKAMDLVKWLYEYFARNPEKMPNEYIQNIEKHGIGPTVCDYIAGMTDRYAVVTFSELFIPTFWQT
jgi:dGTPase